MTMKIYFDKQKDGYEIGWSGFVERSLACRFCESGIAVPFGVHEAREEAAKEARKADLLKKREEAKAENATSKKAPKRSKAVKKVFKKL